MSSEQIEAYWKNFLTRPGMREKYEEKNYSAWSFGSTKESADSLADLVLQGVKRGTASLYDVYPYENEAIPQAGDLSIILNGKGEACCIIETVKVEIYPFQDVPESFARIEGEGDGSLRYWREVHQRAFSMDAEEIGTEFNENSKVICEEIRVIYP